MNLHKFCFERVAAFSLLFWTGCANTQLTREAYPRSATLLRPAPEKETRFIPDAVEIYRNPETDFHRYTAVLIETPRVLLKPERHHPSAKHLDRATARMENQLARYLGEDRVRVESPGPDTLRVRSTLTDFNPQNFLLNVLTFIVVLPLDSGGISAEFEISESETDEVLFAMAARRAGTPLLVLEAFHTYGQAGHGMKKWAQLIHRCLAEPRAEKGPVL